ncbi:MAG: hypothetical protein EXR70_07605 [Deltaproteobacteria bacterium]|nr:hypothetical protein [Deltaproteobacteria bacterium]
MASEHDCYILIVWDFFEDFVHCRVIKIPIHIPKLAAAGNPAAQPIVLELRKRGFKVGIEPEPPAPTDCKVWRVFSLRRADIVWQQNKGRVSERRK